MNVAQTEHEPIIAVIGTGLAGLSAASEALKRAPEARVILIDKAPVVGGNSSKATSGINATETKYQIGSNDSIDLFMEDTLKSGKGLADEALVHILASRSAYSLEDIEASWGLALSDVNRLGGASAARCHRIPKQSDGKSPPVGFSVVNAAKNHLTSEQFLDRFTLLLEHEVLDMTIDPETAGISEIVIKAKEKTNESGEVLQKTWQQKMPVKAVIVASGGYANSSELLLDYAPSYAPHPTTNGWFATGDMLKWGLNHGLQGLHLDQVQLHPTGFINPMDPLNTWTFLCPEIIRGVGGRLLDRGGNRFVKELKTRDEVSAAIEGLDQTIGQAYKDHFTKPDGSAIPCNATTPTIPCSYKAATIVLSQSEAERVGMSSIGFYKFKNLLQTASSKKDIASRLKVPVDAIIKALEDVDDADMPLYYGFVTPSLHYTMGGLKVDQTSRATLEDGRPMPNLFVVGEAAGGVHGANRLGGNGCLESLVFGRWAAQMATVRPGEATVVQVDKSADGKLVDSLTYICADPDTHPTSKSYVLPDKKVPVTLTPQILHSTYTSFYAPTVGLCQIKFAEEQPLWGSIRPGDELTIVEKSEIDEL